ncbi:unnamed protein product [Clavelina lepadiformis]|uniref:Uncharacterized protein n=1 Tax=Clavelina lepadiformis TaxID=159417 RepID=A0ABP0H007_CLALP
MTKMLTTPGIPRRSPIQVLTGPEVAYLPRSNEIGSTQPGGHPSKYKPAPRLLDFRDRTRSGLLNLAVTHPSTNRARGCLTSEIERDQVYSTGNGRRRFQKK